MRILRAAALSLLLAVAPAYAQLQPVPAPTGRVVDNAGMLDASQRGKLEAVLADYEAKTGSQIAVLTVKTTEPEAIEQFSIRVTDAWKLGRKGIDDGVLLLVAPDNPAALRRLRIEAGRGVQGVLTDAQSKRVLQDVIAPHFREKNYYEGLIAGVGAIATLLNQEKFPAPPQAQARAPMPAPANHSSGGFPFTPLIFIVVGFMVLRAVFGGRGRGASLSRGNWGSGATGFVIGNILANAGRGGGGFGGGGFTGGGDSGGGGFSGGGGTFDGGGASGDW